jgi:hypothetical protein
MNSAVSSPRLENPSARYDRSRRIPVVADRVRGRLNWAESAPTGVASRRTGVPPIAVLPLRAQIGRARRIHHRRRNERAQKHSRASNRRFGPPRECRFRLRRLSLGREHNLLEHRFGNPERKIKSKEADEEMARAFPGRARMWQRTRRALICVRRTRRPCSNALGKKKTSSTRRPAPESRHRRGRRSILREALLRRADSRPHSWPSKRPSTNLALSFLATGEFQWLR